MYRSEQNQTKVINRLPAVNGLTEHCLLRKHSKKLNLVENESCRFCRQEEKFALHLLGRCDDVMSKRSRNLGQHHIDREPPI